MAGCQEDDGSGGGHCGSDILCDDSVFGCAQVEGPGSVDSRASSSPRTIHLLHGLPKFLYT